MNHWFILQQPLFAYRLIHDVHMSRKTRTNYSADVSDVSDVVAEVVAAVVDSVVVLSVVADVSLEDAVVDSDVSDV